MVGALPNWGRLRPQGVWCLHPDPPARLVLRELSLQLGQLRALRHLVCTNNRLTELPVSIGCLSRLETLDLDHQLVVQCELAAKLTLLEADGVDVLLLDGPKRRIPVADGAGRRRRVGYSRGRGDGVGGRATSRADGV